VTHAHDVAQHQPGADSIETVLLQLLLKLSALLLAWRFAGRQHRLPGPRAAAQDQAIRGQAGQEEEGELCNVLCKVLLLLLM
jgi:hypothetical protein